MLVPWIGVLAKVQSLSVYLLRADAEPAYLVENLIGGSPSAQDDLSRLVPQDSHPVDLHFENAPVQVVLDELAALGGFEVYFSRDIGELLPIDLRVERADYETVLRRVLNAADLSYRVHAGHRNNGAERNEPLHGSLLGRVVTA